MCACEVVTKGTRARTGLGTIIPGKGLGGCSYLVWLIAEAVLAGHFPGARGQPMAGRALSRARSIIVNNRAGRLAPPGPSHPGIGCTQPGVKLHGWPSRNGPSGQISFASTVPGRLQLFFPSTCYSRQILAPNLIQRKCTDPPVEVFLSASQPALPDWFLPLRARATRPKPKTHSHATSSISCRGLPLNFKLDY